MRLAAAQQDRAAGVLVGQACGDALGVPYEFGSPPRDGRPEMIGGGLGDYAPGEWSDDTQMALCIAEVAATGADLTSADALDAVASRFEEWYASGPADIGVQTRSVLGLAGRLSGSPAERLREASRQVHERTGRSAGNGALMRTSPVALAHLDDPDRAAMAARGIAELTHYDPLAGDSCVLWTDLIRRAVIDGRLPEIDLTLLPEERRDYWSGLVGVAVDSPPKTFVPNGDTMRALQAAYAAIHTAARAESSGSLVEDGLVEAVMVGHDTDTVAAIAGGVLGGLRGLQEVPSRWLDVINGWPGYRADDLVRLALASVKGASTGGSHVQADRAPRG
ncbi:MAG: ADP-ribosylglycohydrolase family protein [Dermatophilaceae bacterium]|nr:ADP-ribosylglycohydrolase family protein [Intrasporangiaceae bacterium]